MLGALFDGIRRRCIARIVERPARRPRLSEPAQRARGDFLQAGMQSRTTSINRLLERLPSARRLAVLKTRPAKSELQQNLDQRTALEVRTSPEQQRGVAGQGLAEIARLGCEHD